MTTNEIRYGEDPTKAILSESALNSKELCDYVINVATGCKHGCRFCYVPSTPQIRTRPDMLEEQAGVENPQQEWGSYVLHRDAERLRDELDGILERKRTWNVTPGGRGVVAMSFSTDCYQDRTTADATRACLETLIDHGVRVRVLTRNPILALQDLDVFKRGAEQNLVTIGSSIPSLDAEEVAALEPRAPAPEHRLRGLKRFSEAGVPVFVSMSPTYPNASLNYLRAMLGRFKRELPTLDVVFHECINPRGGNFAMTVEAAENAGLDDLARKLRDISTEESWRRYATFQLRGVENAAADLDVPLKSWPGKDLVTATAGTKYERWVRGAWMKRSPESFARPPTKGAVSVGTADSSGQMCTDTEQNHGAYRGP